MENGSVASYEEMVAAIDKLEWPNFKEPINGFYNKYELMVLMQNPLKGLQALRIGTENLAEISFYPQDILSVEFCEPSWFFSKRYDMRESLRCYLSFGTSIKIRSKADCDDRFDDGPDVSMGEVYLPLFERIIKSPDIVDVDFIYDTDYWEKRRVKESHRMVPAKKFFRVCFPYEEDSCCSNYYQRGKLDEHGNLLIYWVEDFDGDCEELLGDMDEEHGEF